MDNFSFGDYVVYDPGYTCEVGRFVSYGKDTSKAFVCFHDGCTASCTPTEFLSLYDSNKYPNVTVSPGLGYHRFDRYCADYDESCCFGCLCTLEK